MIRVKLDTGEEYSAEWVHGTYNSTLFMAMDKNEAEVLDLYWASDRELLGLTDSPKQVVIEGLAENLVLHFYHGRKVPDAVMNDWGTNGPSYKVSKVVANWEGIKYELDGKWYEVKYVDNDLILIDGVYYGDFEVSNGESNG